MILGGDAVWGDGETAPDDADGRPGMNAGLIRISEMLVRENEKPRRKKWHVTAGEMPGFLTRVDKYGYTMKTMNASYTHDIACVGSGGLNVCVVVWGGGKIMIPYHNARDFPALLAHSPRKHLPTLSSSSGHRPPIPARGTTHSPQSYRLLPLCESRVSMVSEKTPSVHVRRFRFVSPQKEHLSCCHPVHLSLSLSPPSARRA
jgi:hypothetical protein